MLVGPGVRPILTELTNRALLQHDLNTRVDSDEAFRTLKNEFARRFVAEEQSIDDQAVSALLNHTASTMANRLANWEVFIPVRFTFQTEDVRIRLGDIELLPRRSLKRELRSDILSYVHPRTGEDRCWRRVQVKHALEYYTSYKWAAKVRVYGCDQQTAVPAAKEALLSALDCLHVVFGRVVSSRLRMGDLKVSVDQRATAYRSVGEQLQLSTSRGLLDVMSLPDNWATWLVEPEVSLLLELAGMALETKSRFEQERSLALRFLDCARWFGEAVRDGAPFSKIVKYMTAIERAVVAGARGSIKRTVAKRVSNLLYSSLEGLKWQQTFDDVLAAYRLRSDLVHGSVSPFSDTVMTGIAKCGELAEHTLRVLLFSLSNEGMLARDVSESDYAAWFERTDEHVTALRASDIDKDDALTS